MNRSFFLFLLSLVLVLGSHLEAQAQRRGGGQRSGTYQRTNASGKSSQGTWQSTRQTERGRGYRDHQRNSNLNTERGTINRERNSRTERTGEQTYQRQWNQTTTGPNGDSRTWSGEGSGSVQRAENGATRDYQGTVTTPKGQEYGVDKSATTTKTDDGWERSQSKTVTDSNGNVVGTGQSHTSGGQGQGIETTGSWTNHNRDQTTDYHGTTIRSEDGPYSEREWSNQQGRYSRDVRWRYVNGQWVREQEDSRGGSSEITVDR
jgi:hypothetical protein